MLRPISKVEECKNRFSVNYQNLLNTIFCQSTVTDGLRGTLHEEWSRMQAEWEAQIHIEKSSPWDPPVTGGPLARSVL